MHEQLFDFILTPPGGILAAFAIGTFLILFASGLANANTPPPEGRTERIRRWWRKHYVTSYFVTSAATLILGAIALYYWRHAGAHRANHHPPHRHPSRMGAGRHRQTHGESATSTWSVITS